MIGCCGCAAPALEPDASSWRSSAEAASLAGCFLKMLPPRLPNDVAVLRMMSKLRLALSALVAPSDSAEAAEDESAASSAGGGGGAGAVTGDARAAGGGAARAGAKASGAAG
ncbi:hypothetical protein IWW55_005808, partial [Coemansia sp. RSA 2706]